MVQRVNRRQHAEAARSLFVLAPPTAGYITFAKHRNGYVIAVSTRTYNIVEDLTLFVYVSDEAQNDLLAASLLDFVLRADSGMGFQDGFMGEGWAAAAYSDAARLATSNRLTGARSFVIKSLSKNILLYVVLCLFVYGAVASLRTDGVQEPTLGRLAWIEPSELLDEYPGGTFANLEYA